MLLFVLGFCKGGAGGGGVVIKILHWIDAIVFQALFLLSQYSAERHWDIKKANLPVPKLRSSQQRPYAKVQNKLNKLLFFLCLWVGVGGCLRGGCAHA